MYKAHEEQVQKALLIYKWIRTRMEPRYRQQIPRRKSSQTHFTERSGRVTSDDLEPHLGWVLQLLFPLSTLLGTRIYATTKQVTSKTGQRRFLLLVSKPGAYCTIVYYGFLLLRIQLCV